MSLPVAGRAITNSPPWTPIGGFRVFADMSINLHSMPNKGRQYLRPLPSCRSCTPFAQPTLLYGYMTNRNQSPRRNLVRVKDLQASNAFKEISLRAAGGPGPRRGRHFRCEGAPG